MWGSEFPKPCEAVNFPNLVDHLRGCPLYRLASFWAGHWLSQICGVTQKGYVALLCCNTAGSQWLHSAGFPWQSHKWCAGQSQESSSRFFSGELHANGSGWTVEPHISTPCIANCSLTIIMVRNSGHTRTQTWIICEVVLYVYERERERELLWACLLCRTRVTKRRVRKLKRKGRKRHVLYLLECDIGLMPFMLL